MSRISGQSTSNIFQPPEQGKHHHEIALDEATRQKLFLISPAMIDRLLAPERLKLALRGRSGTKPGTLLTPDSGSDFVNNHLLRYCHQEKIIFTRGRAGKKNDDCFVEQKNYSVLYFFINGCTFRPEPLMKEAPMIRKLAFVLALAGAAAVFPPNAVAQSYPVRPIRFVVPFSPGGGADLVARIIAHPLAGSLGQQVVVDNRAGAQGGVGTAVVANAPPDGYMIVMSHVGALAMNPWLFKEIGYDPIKDFSHITIATSQPAVVVVNPRVPAANLKEFAALAKAKPGNMSFASGSAIGQLAGELFMLLSRTKLLFVPYKGGGPAIIDVVRGQVDAIFASLPASMPMVKAGKLRVIAVAGPTRLPAIPDVLTAKESGFPDFDVNAWYGIAAPANTPGEIVTKLNVEIGRVLNLPAVKDKLLAQGLEARTNSPEEMTSYVKKEYERWGKVVKVSGLGTSNW